MTNWKNIFKSWAGVPVLILLAFLAVWLVVAVSPKVTTAFKSWQAKRAYEKLMEPYYKDTYGGETPEETYDLFISALKDGDVELASKYFTIGDQEKWTRTLIKFKEEGSLAAFAQERENLKSGWKKSNKSTEATVSFTYQVLIEEDSTATFEGQEINIPAGNYTNESVFIKYPTGIWKIDSL